MTALRVSVVVAALVATSLATVGCSKKEDAKSGGGATSSLPWTPVGYDKMSAACKQALACCEEIAKSEGAKSAMDFNGKCSGPALWKDDDCEMDRKSRVATFEGENKPVPDACK